MSDSVSTTDREFERLNVDSSWDPDVTRLLEMLMREPDGASMKTMRDAGIEAPAQAIYMLQLAGCRIDRLSVGLQGTSAYRLSPGTGDDEA